MLLYFYESESNFICNSIMVGTYKNNIKILTDINIIHLAFSFCSVINYKYLNHNNMHIAYTHHSVYIQHTRHWHYKLKYSMCKKKMIHIFLNELI